MGRRYYYRKATVEESCDLRVSYLKQYGLLSDQPVGEISWTNNVTGKITTVLLVVVTTTDDPFVTLKYTVTDNEVCEYEVSLLTTPCNFGGKRYWFGCPICCKRVGVLYLAPDQIYFTCRYCSNLSYYSRNRSKLGAIGHAFRQIEELRSRIKRWTWRGRPTRKARKLFKIQNRLNASLQSSTE